jgi:hypothetical protein
LKQSVDRFACSGGRWGRGALYVGTGAGILREPLGQLGRVARQRERTVVVFGLAGGLRGAPQPHDGVDTLLALPESIRRLQRPDHILGVGGDYGRNRTHRRG